MRLIIGGAHQGKRSYAMDAYGIAEADWVMGESCSREDLLQAKAVYGFHRFLRREMEAGHEVADLAELLWEKNPELLLVTDEVGYGIVPMDAMDRAWREACGRVCTKLAAHAEEVVRVSCGLGMKIKG